MDVRHLSPAHAGSSTPLTLTHAYAWATLCRLLRRLVAANDERCANVSLASSTPGDYSLI